MPPNPVQQATAKDIHPCFCNGAHRQLSHIIDAIGVWSEGKEIRDPDKVALVNSDLSSLYLMARSRYTSKGGAPEQIACERFLSLAWNTISNVPAGNFLKLHTFANLRSFWLAFAAVGVEFVSFTREKNIAIPEEDVRSRIRKILANRQNDVALHCHITNGLAHIATTIQTYDAWVTFVQVWGQIIDDLPAYWLNALRDIRNIRDPSVASGVLSIVDLWHAMGSLYRAAYPVQREGLEPLRDETIRKATSVLEILAVYYSTRTKAAATPAENVWYLLYALVRPGSGSLGEDGIKRLTEGAELIRNMPDINEAGREFIQHIMDLLKPLPPNGDADSDDAFPMR